MIAIEFNQIYAVCPFWYSRVIAAVIYGKYCNCKSCIKIYNWYNDSYVLKTCNTRGCEVPIL